MGHTTMVTTVPIGPHSVTLATVWERFTKPERKALVDLLRLQWGTLHMGSLPFIGLNAAIACVNAVQMELERLAFRKINFDDTITLNGRRIAEVTVDYIPLLHDKLHCIEKEILQQTEKVTHDP